MPRRKAPDQRQGRGTSDASRAPEKLTKPPPPHPSGKKLLAAVVTAWDAYWDSELAQLVVATDLPAIRRLFQMYDMRERMDRALREQPFVLGSTGQLVAHPASKEIASLDGRILALEDRFGITPMGRLKLGVTFGAAAKSLEALNRDFEDPGQEGPEEDPRQAQAPKRGSRRQAIETTATDPAS